MSQHDVLRGDDELLIQSGDDQHVFKLTGEGAKYDPEKSEATDFPSETILDIVRDEVSGDVDDIFPVEVSFYAQDDSNTRQLLRSAGLPQADGLVDLFWHYPGEIEIEGEVTFSDVGGYSFEPTALVYAGKRFTPE